MSDRIEFYSVDSKLPFLSMESSFQPNAGDLVSIKNATYEVVGRSFAADYSESIQQKHMRCNVIVKLTKKK